jgi:hypothetical protein
LAQAQDRFPELAAAFNLFVAYVGYLHQELGDVSGDSFVFYPLPEQFCRRNPIICDCANCIFSQPPKPSRAPLHQILGKSRQGLWRTYEPLNFDRCANFLSLYESESSTIVGCILAIKRYQREAAIFTKVIT